MMDIMSERKKRKRGPKPDRLVIETEEWQDAVQKAVKKKRPKDGWPEPDKKKDAKNGG